MYQELTIKFLDGHVVDGILSHPFNPAVENIEMVSRFDQATYLFTLREICYILFHGKPRTVLTEEAGQEEIETTTEDHFMAVVMNDKKYSNGFYAVPVDPETHAKSIFFTFRGIRHRCQSRPIGAILEANGLISSSNIQAILKEQENTPAPKKAGEIISEAAQVPKETIEKTLQKAVSLQDPRMKQKLRVGDILVSAGLVTREQVERALAKQGPGKRKKVGELLIEHGLISEEQLLSALATKFQMPFVDLINVTPSEEALAAISKGTALRLQVLPIEIYDRNLVVAISEPTDPALGDSLRFVSNYTIHMVVARPKQIAECLDLYYGGGRNGVAGIGSIETLVNELSDEVITLEEEASDARITETDSQVINIVNSLLLEAKQQGASDIHLEPGVGRRPLQVRYRVDGECAVVHKIPQTHANAIISRLKIMAKLDIAERRRPQSGKIMLITGGNKKIEYRLEITPTIEGREDAVLRVLASSKPLPLEELGFSSSNLSGMRKILAKPYGIILCVGPTGSGKTTTLHSALHHINEPNRKIWTAEDPVEITQEGLRQVQVNAKIGLTFQEAMRSFLRADPDVIMIGEMRDPETAKIAIEASLTGHLVFSTLHTNSAPETVVRLIEMGMEPFNFANAFLGILAQRLARRLCNQCKEPFQPTRTKYDMLVDAYGAEWFRKDGHPEFEPNFTLMRAVGCEACGKSGYKGRLAIHELMVGTESIKIAIKKKLSSEELRDLALAEGMRTLMQDGVAKVLRGDTDMEQILRVSV